MIRLLLFMFVQQLMNLLSLPECSIIAMLLVCYIAIITLTRYFNESGLYVYLCIATIIANIQVMRGAEFIFFQHPIALGSALFSTTFLATDILSEYYGYEKAKKAVFLGFIGMLLMTIIMQLTINIAPVSDTSSHFYTQHMAMNTIFAPNVAIFIASICAYLTSQFYDVWLYNKIRNWNKASGIVVRSILAGIIAIFIDNFIFSWLAWRVFASQPMEWSVLLNSYVFGTYLLRLGFNIANVGIIYSVGYIRKCSTINHLKEKAHT